MVRFINNLIIFGMILLAAAPMVLGASWSAYVLNESGSSINSANVSAVSNPGGVYLNSTLTDAAGFFNLAIPDSTSVVLITSKSNYLDDTSQSLPPITTSILLPFNITLIQAILGNITGKITDNAGSGLADKTVKAIQGDLVKGSAITNSSGDYIIIDLIDGTYTLNLTLDGITQQFINIVVLPGSQTLVDLPITLDIYPPRITDVGASLITSSEAVISWLTNEDSNSSVSYGTDTLTPLSSHSSSLATSHLIRLISLSSSTLYYYNVSSCDSDGNCNASAQFSFTTSAEEASTAGGGAIVSPGLEGEELEGEIPKQLFDIRLNLADRFIQSVSELVAIVRFENFGSEPIPVDILLTIIDNEGNEVYSGTDYIVVETEEIFRKGFEDLDLPHGKYTLILTTLYNVDVIDEFRQEFKIGDRRELFFEELLSIIKGHDKWYIIGTLLFMAIVMFILRLLKARKRKKERRFNNKINVMHHGMGKKLIFIKHKKKRR